MTHVPGPNGKNDIESFTSNRSAGYLGAVQSFTDPQFAHTLAAKLNEENGGKVPRFYQVPFQVRCRDGVPMETKFVLGREMHWSISPVDVKWKYRRSAVFLERKRP